MIKCFDAIWNMLCNAAQACAEFVHHVMQTKTGSSKQKHRQRRSKQSRSNIYHHFFGTGKRAFGAGLSGIQPRIAMASPIAKCRNKHPVYIMGDMTDADSEKEYRLHIPPE
jgi:hypothetical protein